MKFPELQSFIDHDEKADPTVKPSDQKQQQKNAERNKVIIDLIHSSQANFAIAFAKVDDNYSGQNYIELVIVQYDTKKEKAKEAESAHFDLRKGEEDKILIDGNNQISIKNIKELFRELATYGFYNFYYFDKERNRYNFIEIKSYRKKEIFKYFISSKVFTRLNLHFESLKKYLLPEENIPVYLCNGHDFPTTTEKFWDIFNIYSNFLFLHSSPIDKDIDLSPIFLTLILEKNKKDGIFTFQRIRLTKGDFGISSEIINNQRQDLSFKNVFEYCYQKNPDIYFVQETTAEPILLTDFLKNLSPLLQEATLQLSLAKAAAIKFLPSTLEQSTITNLNFEILKKCMFDKRYAYSIRDEILDEHPELKHLNIAFIRLSSEDNYTGKTNATLVLYDCIDFHYLKLEKGKSGIILQLTKDSKGEVSFLKILETAQSISEIFILPNHMAIKIDDFIDILSPRLAPIPIPPPPLVSTSIAPHATFYWPAEGSSFGIELANAQSEQIHENPLKNLGVFAS